MSTARTSGASALTTQATPPGDLPRRGTLRLRSGQASPCPTRASLLLICHSEPVPSVVEGRSRGICMSVPSTKCRSLTPRESRVRDDKQLRSGLERKRERGAAVRTTQGRAGRAFVAAGPVPAAAPRAVILLPGLAGNELEAASRVSAAVNGARRGGQDGDGFLHWTNGVGMTDRNVCPPMRVLGAGCGGVNPSADSGRARLYASSQDGLLMRSDASGTHNASTPGVA
jgi:hypothetical protein